MNSWTPSQGPDSNRRRSQRVMLNLPVTVTGKTIEGQFIEDTHTMVVNAHGALIGLKARVAKGQTVFIRTASHPENQECQVIWVGPTAEGKTQCGLEFTQPSPKFWGVSFPPADWSPASSGIASPVKNK